MEGSYNKIFLSWGNVPADSYSFFIDELVHTIRYVSPLAWTLGACARTRLLSLPPPLCFVVPRA